MCGYVAHGVGALRTPDPVIDTDENRYCGFCEDWKDFRGFGETEDDREMCADCAEFEKLRKCPSCWTLMSEEEIIGDECLLCRIESSSEKKEAADREARAQELVNLCFDIVRSR